MRSTDRGPPRVNNLGDDAIKVRGHRQMDAHGLSTRAPLINVASGDDLLY